jgi:hypothetical protein
VICIHSAGFPVRASKLKVMDLVLRWHQQRSSGAASMPSFEKVASVPRPSHFPFCSLTFQQRP